MGLYDDIKAKGAAYRLTEEALYAEALREIESGQRRDGIWAKAMAESDMDAGKAGAKYIKMRVQALKDEITVFIATLQKDQPQPVREPVSIQSDSKHKSWRLTDDPAKDPNHWAHLHPGASKNQPEMPSVKGAVYLLLAGVIALAASLLTGNFGGSIVGAVLLALGVIFY
jgi:hypothetical protein